MFINQIKLAFRNFGKNKVFTLINLSGLAIGMGVFMLILLWIQYELSYNGFHRDKDRIAAIMTNQTFAGSGTSTFPAVPSLLAPALMKDLAFVETATTTSWGDRRQFTFGDKSFMEYGLYVSPEFLTLFSFPLIEGNHEDQLTEPNTILITEKLAKKYFKDTDPIGKLITIEQNTPYKVTGVLKDVPSNATLSFDFLMPVKDYIQWAMVGREEWDINNMRSYLKLKKGVDTDEAENLIKTFVQRYTDKQPNSELMLFYLKDWYLKMDFKNGKYAGGGKITYVRFFAAICFIILLLACINFMNLSTAKATQRAKEVGVRKTIGANHGSLIRQFLTESILLASLAGFLACLLLTLALPGFNTLLRKHIVIDYESPAYLLIFTGIILLTGFMAGIYPAFALSSFSPIQALKNKGILPSLGSVGLRKILVVSQFSASILLIIGTLTVFRQIQFIQNKNLGYDRNQLIWFANNLPAEKNQLAMQEFLKVPGVKHTAMASMTFTMANNRGAEVSWPGKSKGQEIFFSFIASSHNIIQTMGLQMKEGRSFSSEIQTDTGTFILNEEAVKRMGLKNPVGQILETKGGRGTIVGVVKDFHFESLHQEIAPVIITCRPDWTWLYYVKTDGVSPQQTIAGLERVYKDLAPGAVFEYNFQDKEYDRLYRSEQQMGVLVNWFAFLALFISSLGLLGLSIFTVERKTKEIGIRKVLGAHWSQIVHLLSKEFIVLVGIAGILAIPLGYFLMNKWLNGYAFRVDLDWWVFVLAGAVALLITLFTVSLQAIRAASVNPVSSLRSE